jgi:hypothetical protein
MEGSSGGPPLGEIHEHRTNNDTITNYIIEQTSELKVRQDEKKKFGEVFTPVSLIDEMLKRLPLHVWENPNYKWLDPAAGIGNFPMMVYRGLMIGLEKAIPGLDTRSEHIIRNMLYMVEVNRTSCVKIEQTFGTAANLICGSIIESDIKFKDQTITFDVIVCNPPYNAPQKSQGKPGGGSTLWNKFVDKSLDKWLKPDGYMTFVHPSGWRKPPSECSIIKHMFDKMVHLNYMSYLKIHNKCSGAKIFGAQTRFDFYVIQKRPPTQSELTIVVDQEGHETKLDLSKWDSFLPNHSFDLISGLLADTEQDYLIYSRCQYGTDKKNESFVKKSQSVTHPYPLIHSIIMSGPKIYGTNVIKKSPPMFGVPKIVMTESGIRNGVYLDFGGEYGMTQGTFGLKIPYPIDIEGPLMKHALQSVLFARIVDAMSFGNFRVDRNMFHYFRWNFYKDPQFKDSPQISSISRDPLCDGDGDGDGDGDDDGCECGGGAAERPNPKFTITRAAKQSKPSYNEGGRTRRRQHSIKFRKYRKRRHTRKKHRLQ